MLTSIWTYTEDDRQLAKKLQVKREVKQVMKQGLNVNAKPFNPRSTGEASGKSLNANAKPFKPLTEYNV